MSEIRYSKFDNRYVIIAPESFIDHSIEIVNLRIATPPTAHFVRGMRIRPQMKFSQFERGRGGW